MTKQSKRTWLFIGAFILAGCCNLFSRTGIPQWDTLMTLINYSIFTGLLLFWIRSVRVRLLPSEERTYMLVAAFMMLFFLLLRIFKYRFALDAAVLRYSVYLYSVPMALIPALFLMICICIKRGSERGAWNERLVLIPAFIPALLFLTNDFHFLVYRPSVALSGFIVDEGTYSYGPGFYILYGWMAAAFLAGIILLLSGRSVRRNRVLSPMAVLLIWAVLLIAYTFSIRVTKYRFWNDPDINIFCMLGIFESSIRNRLIPFNENYAGFFRHLQMPVSITDKDFRPVYRSEREMTFAPGEFRLALAGSLYLTPVRKLSGRKLRAGYAFWEEDESDLYNMRERLMEANELIEQENILFQAETDQREKDAWLQSRHRIYHEIAEEMHPCQQKIEQILERICPKEDDYREQIAMVSVLNAYVKRKTNLLLLAAEHDRISTSELQLALEESANYLKYAGLQTTVLPGKNRPFPADRLIALYDTFESVAEQLIGKSSSMMVSWYENGLRLAAAADGVPDTADLPVPVRIHRSEDILYMDICAGEKGGDSA